MPKTDDASEVIKNIDFDEGSKKKKTTKLDDPIDEEDSFDTSEDEEEDDEEDEEDEEDEDDEDDEDDEEDAQEGLTDVGLYNVLGSFLMDEEGNSIGVSLSNIAKELGKLNHSIKKYTKSS
jgi:uncharacterized membrane protein YdbT with pleckstrin-like domain